MPIIKLTAAEKRRVTIFSTCLVLAIVAWLLTGLSSSYTYKVTGILTYKNAPQRRAFHSQQPDTVEVLQQGTGWQMLFSGLSSTKTHIPVDLHTLEHQDYLVLSRQLPAINATNSTGHKILLISPDTLYYDFSKRVSRKIPVQVVATINYQPQYAPYKPAVISPAYVTVSGPGNVIAGVKFWKTDSLKLNNVNETVNARVKLSPVKEGNISVYPKTVAVQLPVDEFTEKSVWVPVKLINNPRYYNVKIFPQKVKVTFTTALKRYRETDDNFFEATADLQLWTDHQTSILPVNLNRVPAYGRVLRIEPRTVDFMITK